MSLDDLSVFNASVSENSNHQELDAALAALKSLYKAPNKLSTDLHDDTTMPPMEHASIRPARKQQLLEPGANIDWEIFKYHSGFQNNGQSLFSGSTALPSTIVTSDPNQALVPDATLSTMPTQGLGAMNVRPEAEDHLQKLEEDVLRLRMENIIKDREIRVLRSEVERSRVA
ncbi:hypothetical protein ST47_g487 [Ascochyta rabiei]|uniref:Uncharacterized protein n=1 Tax=Didymella rabiei TaxID=5454 RepID=A0A163M399_DIDRA|nr:hypothetical protein ST47_g487 [Ascochyta rabiei]